MARGEYYMDDAPVSDDGVFGTEGMKGVNVADNPPATSLTDILRSNNTPIPVRGKAFQDQSTKYNLNYGQYFEDDSVYDNEIADLTRLERDYTVNQLRGEIQSGAAQIGSGLLKGAVLAGTTFADGIVGTIVGIGTAASENRWSGIWDNPFSNLMQEINEWSETALPNYYTKSESEDPWYTNIFTANFIGDKVLKNLGFMVGAAYSGKIGANAFSKIAGLNEIRQAYKGATNAAGEGFKSIRDVVKAANAGEDVFLNGERLTAQLIKDAKYLKNMQPVQKITGGFMGALGEARIEAIGNSKDWFDLKKQQLDDAYNQVQQQELDALYNEAPNLFSYQKSADGSMVLTPDENALAIAKGRAQQKFDYEGGLAKITEDRLKMGNADFLMNVGLLTVSDAWQFGKFYAGGYSSARKMANIVKKVTDGKISYAAPQRGWLKKTAKVLQKGIAEGPFEEMGQATISRAAGYKYASELNDFYGAKIDPEAEEETQGWIKSTAKAISDTYGDINSYEEGFIGFFSGMLGVPSIRRTKSRDGKFQSPITLEGGMWEDIGEINEQNQREQEIVSALNARVQSPEFLNYYQGMIRHNKYQRDMDRAVEGGDNFEFKNAEHSQFISDVNMFEKAGRLNDLYDIIEQAETIKPEDIAQIKTLTTDPQSGKAVYENAQDEDIISDIKKRASKARDWVNRYREISDSLQTKAGTERTSDELDELTWMMTKIDDWQGRFNDLTASARERLEEIDIRTQNIEIGPQEAKVKLSEVLNLPTNQLLQRLASDSEGTALIETADKAFNRNPNKADIMSELTDLSRIAKARNEFVNKYNDYINNPGKLAKVIADDEEAIQKATEEGNVQDLRDKIESAQTREELDDIINNETDQEAIDKVLGKLREEGNPLVQEKDEYDSLVDDIQTSLEEISPDDETLTDAQDLLNEVLSRGGNIEDLTEAIIDGTFDPETLGDESRTIKAAYILQDALGRSTKAKENKDDLADIELPTNDKVDKDTENDEDSVARTTRPYEPPVGDITPEEVREGNKGYIPEASGDFLSPAISEFHIEAQRDGDFRAFPIVELERSGRDYTTIYGELVDRKAFDYVNNGELHEGDEIRFMIDPAFEAKVKNNPSFTKPTIFMVKEVDGRNQVVGVLPVAAKYKGTTELQKRVIEGYEKSNKTEPYVSPESTKVHKIMVGRVPSGDIMRPLSEIPGVGAKSVFGVMKGGRIVTGKTNIEIEQPQDVSNKDGRLYLMIPAPNGKMRPSFVRVKHLNRKEYDMADPQNVSTPLYDNLSAGLSSIAASRSQAELDEAVALLSETVYTGDLFFDHVEGERGTFIRITKVYRDENGNYIYENKNGEQVLKKSKPEFIKLEGEKAAFKLMDTGSTVEAQESSERSIEEIQAELTEKLMKFNQPFQVSVSKINKGSYNEYLINSGVLTSDILEARYRGSFFMANPFNPDGTTRQAVVPPSPKPSPGKKADNDVGGKETVLRGTRVTLGNEEYSVDNNTIYDKNGQVIKPENSDVIKAIAYVQRTYGNSKNGVNMIDGIVLIGNRVFDSNNNTFLKGKAVSDFKKALKPAPGASPVNKVDAAKEASEILKEAGVNTSTGSRQTIGNSDNKVIGGLHLQGLPEIAATVDSHGIAKGNETEFLLNFLYNGIDTSRRFDTAPLSKSSENSGAGLGTGSGTSYSDGLFIIASKPGETLLRSDGSTNIDVVLINDMDFEGENPLGAEHANKIKEVLSKRFPNTTFILYSEANEYYSKYSENSKSETVSKESTQEPAKETKTGKEAEIAEKLNKINESQARVDRENSTRDSFRILEDDGQYHEYRTASNVLGPNWVEKPENVERLKGVEAELFNRSENPEKFKEYLKTLEAIYNIDLSKYDTSSASRDEIVGVVRDALNNTNSQRALKAKASIDGIVGSFLSDPSKAIERPENLSEESYNSLISSLTRIKDQLDTKGETIVGTNIVVYHTFPDGARIASEVDIVTMDKDGNFKFIDIKSGKYSFHDFTGSNGKKMNFFENKSRFQNMSSRDYYTQQMSMAKNIFESQFGSPVSSMGILPFVIEYNEAQGVEKMTMEKGIGIKYNPLVKVPVVSQPAQKTASEPPIFNSILETRAPIDMTQDSPAMEGSKVGYYVTKDGQLYKGNLLLMGTIQGTKVYLTRETVEKKGLGKKTFVDYTYKAIFENNGRSVVVGKNVATDRQLPLKEFMSLLENNAEMVKGIIEAVSPISDFNSKMDNSIERSVNKLNAAKGTIGKRRPKFRLADRTENKIDLKQELSWLKEVLPGLSTEDRLKIQKGLITVAEKGAQAWGQYENGIITLSDIAAEGTVYHEAFHAVYDLMTTQEEKENLMREAVEKYGDLSDSQLEERLAEEFREYTMGIKNKSLGKRILDFFKSLFSKVNNWNRIKPYTYSFFQQINQGKFAGRSETALRASKKTIQFEGLKKGVRSMLEAKGWTVEMWDKISEKEKKHAIKCASL